MSETTSPQTKANTQLPAQTSARVVKMGGPLLDVMAQALLKEAIHTGMRQSNLDVEIRTLERKGAIPKDAVKQQPDPVPVLKEERRSTYILRVAGIVMAPVGFGMEIASFAIGSAPLSAAGALLFATGLFVAVLNIPISP